MKSAKIISDCCSVNGSDTIQSKRHSCPGNGRSYAEVPRATLLHHIKQPWLHELKQQAYYFCEDPDCDVVYFGEDNSVIKKDQIRTQVGIKQSSPDSLICYCFGITREQAENNPQTKAFVLEQTRQSVCACESRNPSGRCCLKNFPK